VKTKPLEDKIWTGAPEEKIYRRLKPDERERLEKQERRIEKDRVKKLEDMLTIMTKQDQLTDVNYENIYQTDMHPNFKQLEEFVKKFKDKDTTKDRDVEKVRKKAEEKYRDMKAD